MRLITFIYFIISLLPFVLNAQSIIKKYPYKEVQSFNKNGELTFREFAVWEGEDSLILYKAGKTYYSKTGIRYFMSSDSAGIKFYAFKHLSQPRYWPYDYDTTVLMDTVYLTGKWINEYGEGPSNKIMSLSEWNEFVKLHFRLSNVIDEYFTSIELDSLHLDKHRLKQRVLYFEDNEISKVQLEDEGYLYWNLQNWELERDLVGRHKSYIMNLRDSSFVRVDSNVLGIVNKYYDGSSEKLHYEYPFYFNSSETRISYDNRKVVEFNKPFDFYTWTLFARDIVESYGNQYELDNEPYWVKIYRDGNLKKWREFDYDDKNRLIEIRTYGENGLDNTKKFSYFD